MGQLEYGDYYKFLVSTGMALVVGAVGYAWLFLHDPFDLTVETTKLQSFTPSAQRIILRRQEIVGYGIATIPYVVGGLGSVGLVLITVGLLGWKRRQVVRDKREDADAKIRQLEAMTAEQIREAARTDVIKQQQASASMSVPSSEEPTEEIVDKYLAVEELFLNVLESRIPRGYTLLRHQQSMSYRFDAILKEETGAKREYFIEFTYLLTKFSVGGLDSSLNTVGHAASWADFDSGILHVPMVLVVFESLDPQMLEDASRLLRTSEGSPTAFGRSLIRFVSLDRLETLSAKDIADILDTSQRLLVLANAA